MHRLYLLRHLKSSWEEPGLDDHDRPLADRGRKAGRRMRGHFAAEGLHPQLVLCSSATRAVQTWEAIRAAAPEAELEVTDGIYGADTDTLMRLLNGVPEAVSSVLLIGHSPAIEQLALALSANADSAALASLEAKYPTGGLASLSLSSAWAELAPASARLDAFVVPREL